MPKNNVVINKLMVLGFLKLSKNKSQVENSGGYWLMDESYLFMWELYDADSSSISKFKRLDLVTPQDLYTSIAHMANIS